MRAVATEISAETSAGGFVIPGDHVDVILAHRDREAEKRTNVETYTSETIINECARARGGSDRRGQERAEGRHRQDRDARTHAAPGRSLALGKQMGTLSLSLRSVSDTGKTSGDSEEDPASRRGGVNMVRFGVSTTAVSK